MYRFGSRFGSIAKPYPLALGHTRLDKNGLGKMSSAVVALRPQPVTEISRLPGT